MIKEEDYTPSQEIREVKTLMVHDRFAQVEEKETESTQALLGLSTTTQPMNEPHVSTAFCRTLLEMKEIPKKDEGILLPVNCKNPKQGIEAVGNIIDTRDVVDEAGILRHRVVLEPSPSKFDPSSKQHPPRCPLSMLRLGF